MEKFTGFLKLHNLLSRINYISTLHIIRQYNIKLAKVQVPSTKKFNFTIKTAVLFMKKMRTVRMEGLQDVIIIYVFCRYTLSRGNS